MGKCSVSRRTFLQGSLLGASLAPGFSWRQERNSSLDRAERLHRDALVIDTYGSLNAAALGRRRGGLNAIVQGISAEELFVSDPREGIIDPPRRGANIIEHVFKGPHVVKRILQRTDELLRKIERNKEHVEPALSARDVERIAQQGKTSVIMMLNAGWIDNDLAVLRMYYHLGIRVFALAHIAAFDWVDSSGELNENSGLTEFGKEVVRECNRVRMLVDISHASDQAFWDTIKTTSRPVIATHSGCRALCYVQRNLTDEMLRTLAKNGGVVGIYSVSSYLDEKARDDMMKGRYLPDFFERDRKLAAQFSDPFELAQATRAHPITSYTTTIELPAIDVMLDHIDHAVKIAGINHVAVSSDNEGLKGLEDVSQWQNLTHGLLSRGYTEAQVRKILGENFLRVLDSRS